MREKLKTVLVYIAVIVVLLTGLFISFSAMLGSGLIIRSFMSNYNSAIIAATIGLIMYTLVAYVTGLTADKLTDWLVYEKKA